MRRPRVHHLVPAVLLASVACGGEPEGGEAAGDAAPAAATPATPERRVEIVSPAEGDTVTGPRLEVTLAAHGFTVVQAGDTTPNSGHHHLFLDRDVSPMGSAIPAEVGFIVHMGDGSATYAFENVEPGEHRLIAVVGDAIHVPVEALMDTVRFVVRGPAGGG